MRYVRQLCDAKQLQTKSILVVGAGALGCAAIPYLLGAGVGKVAVIDPDRVELSNLHRQVLYDESQISLPKVDAARQKLEKLNSTVAFVQIPFALDSSNAQDLIGSYDLILDATDRFSSKILIDETCFLLKKPWIYASIDRWVGQVALFFNNRFTDLFPGPLDDAMSFGCSAGGMIGPLAGVLGSIQALEAIKWLDQSDSSLRGKLMRIDALSWKMQLFSFETEDNLIIDIRRPEEISEPIGELAIPYPEILNANLPKDRKIVLVCRSGVRSEAAAKELREKGYQATAALR